MKFLLHTQIGVENITEVELLDKYKGLYSLDYAGYVPHKNGIVQVDWRSDKNLDFYNNLGTVEDAYFVLEYAANVGPHMGLKDLYRQLDANKIKQAVDYFFDNLNPFDSSKKFRFVTRKKAAHDFRRIDLENGIKEYFKRNIPRVEIDGDEGDKEIWTTLLKNRLIITIRLTTKEMRQGYYKTAMVDGSLRPSVGYAMAYLAELKSTESVWLPFCGAGTIGCEISEEFKFKKLMNSDISEVALEASKVNFSNLKSYKQNK
jgi:23S rRNA G2445 N2-methylase RlmL